MPKYSVYYAKKFDSFCESAVELEKTHAHISKVPATWIQQAKTQCRIGYGHTSHGSQLVTGIATLFSQLGSPYDYTSLNP